MTDRKIPEINYLMSLVEQKFRKSVKTSTDFIALANEIESETNESVSASTLKRIWGYVNMSPMPRQNTLNILARYIGKGDYKSFCEDLKTSAAYHSMFFSADFIRSCDLNPKECIEIGWDPDRIVTLRHLGDSRFEVISSQNSKLESGDLFTVSDFIKGSPLYISQIQRGNNFTSSYIAGRQGGLKHLRKL